MRVAAADDIVAPPYALQRAGWECAYVLAEDHQDRLSRWELQQVRTIEGWHPERLRWRDIGAMLALFNAVAG